MRRFPGPLKVSPARHCPPQLAVFQSRTFPCQLADLRGWGRALAAAEAFTLGLAAGVAAPLGSVVDWTLG